MPGLIKKNERKAAARTEKKAARKEKRTTKKENKIKNKKGVVGRARAKRRGY